MRVFESAREAVPSTPAMVIDLSTVQQNLQRAADYAREHQLQMRPHTKTHKSKLMSQLQMAAGASGLTMAKVGEVEALQDESTDVLVAYPAIDSARTQRLADLADRITLRVAVDSATGIQALGDAARRAGKTFGILIDLDIGFHRTGVQSPAEALALAQQVETFRPALRLDGIFFYPGHVWTPAAEQGTDLSQIDTLLAETIDLWKQAGLPAEIVSGGSTPTLFQSHLVSSQTEIRPGTYIYNDMNTVRAGFCTVGDVAAATVCTVISTAVPGKAVIDGGTKTFTSDRNVRYPDSGHGLILEYPDARIVRLSEEHGEVDFSQSSRSPRVGERVTIIPNHICPCVNLQDQVWLQQTDRTLQTLTIDSRGRLS